MRELEKAYDMFIEEFESTYRQWLIDNKGKYSKPEDAMDAFVTDFALTTTLYCYSVFKAVLYDEDEMAMNMDDYYGAWGIPE